MSTIALLGAGGTIAGLIAAELVDRGHDVVAVGRDERRVRAGLEAAGIGSVTDVRIAEVGDLDALSAAVDGTQALVDAVAPVGPTAGNVVEVARRTGLPLVDVAPEQSHVRALYGRDDQLRAAGVTVVPGVGLQHLIGDTLSHVAGSAVERVEEVHVAYTLPDRGSALGAASAGRRRSVAAELDRPGYAWEHGALVEELPGEARRLAWFPRPVGPSHAAAIPAGEAISVPRHLPGVAGVRTYLAVPGWRAELLQATANAARWAPARRWLTGRLERDRPSIGPARRAATRWGCVAEARGLDGVARAWAYGHDPYRLTAVSVAEITTALLAGASPAGVLAPSQILEPTDLLDRLAAVTDLRWSISRPDAQGTGRTPVDRA